MNQPLPLSVFEEYMFLDTQPDFPMSPLMIFTFNGKAEIALLRQAFEDSIQHEPLFCSVVKKIKGRWCWVRASALPVFRQEETSLPSEWTGSGNADVVYFDLQRQPGVHCVYRKTTTGFVIELSIHHSVCDGLGTMRFIGNWFARYGELIGDTQDLETYYPNSERIREREQLNIELPHPVSPRTATKSFLYYASQWFFKRPCRLNSSTNIPSSHTQPQCFWRQLSETFSNNYRAAAKRRNVSVNSLFLADYFIVLNRWFQQCHKTVSPKTMFRVLVPTNLRKSCHDDIPAANMLGYAFIDYYVKDLNDFETLCTNLQTGIQFTKDWSLGALFLHGAAFVKKVPFGLRLMASPLFCHSTSVFSNIGSPCRILLQKRFRESSAIKVGEAELIQILGSPPVRPHTRFSAGLVSQNNRWTLTISADLNAVSNADVELFQTMLIERFEETASS